MQTLFVSLRVAFSMFVTSLALSSHAAISVMDDLEKEIVLTEPAK